MTTHYYYKIVKVIELLDCPEGTYPIKFEVPNPTLEPADKIYISATIVAQKLGEWLATVPNPDMVEVVQTGPSSHD